MSGNAKASKLKAVAAQTDRTVIPLFSTKGGDDRDRRALLVMSADGGVTAVEYFGSDVEGALERAGIEGYALNDSGPIEVPPEVIQGCLARWSPISYFGILRRAEGILARGGSALAARSFEKTYRQELRLEREFAAALSRLQEYDLADMEVLIPHGLLVARVGRFVLVRHPGDDETEWLPHYTYKEHGDEVVAHRWMSEFILEQAQGGGVSRSDILERGEGISQETQGFSLAERAIVARYGRVEPQSDREFVVALEALADNDEAGLQVCIRERRIWATQVGPYVLLDESGYPTYERHESAAAARQWMSEFALAQPLHPNPDALYDWQGALPANYR